MNIPMSGSEIESPDDVKTFFTQLSQAYGQLFTPDEDFFRVQDMDGNYVFSDSDAEALNEMMIHCAQVCDANGLNIYDVVNGLSDSDEEETGS